MKFRDLSGIFASFCKGFGRKIQTVFEDFWKKTARITKKIEIDRSPSSEGVTSWDLGSEQFLNQGCLRLSQFLKILRGFLFFSLSNVQNFKLIDLRAQKELTVQILSPRTYIFKVQSNCIENGKSYMGFLNYGRSNIENFKLIVLRVHKELSIHILSPNRIFSKFRPVWRKIENLMWNCSIWSSL